MSSYINTNIASLNTQRSLNQSNIDLAKSLQRLSSGLMANRARDDSAGLALSQRMEAQIKGLTSAQQNRNDAISVAQVVDGSLSETSEVLKRMRDITLQSLNSATSGADRDSLNKEFSQLKSEALKIASTTSFKGQNLLTLNSGDTETLTFGLAELDRSKVALINNKDPDKGILHLASSDTFNISGSSTAEQRLGVLSALDSMIAGVSTARGAAGAFQVEAAPSFTSIGTDDGLYTPAISRPSFDNFPSMSEKARNIVQQAAQGMAAQANSTSQLIAALLRG